MQTEIRELLNDTVANLTKLAAFWVGVKRKFGQDRKIAAFKQTFGALLLIGDLMINDLQLGGKQVLRLGDCLFLQERACAEVGCSSH